MLISAHELHYPLDRIPQFWTWLLAQWDAGKAKLPFEIFGEIANSTGDLRDWLTAPDHNKKLRLAEQVDGTILQNVISSGYAPDLTESELEQIGQDPFLVAYAPPVWSRGNRGDPRSLEELVENGVYWLGRDGV